MSVSPENRSGAGFDLASIAKVMAEPLSGEQALNLRRSLLELTRSLTATPDGEPVVVPSRTLVWLNQALVDVGLNFGMILPDNK